MATELLYKTPEVLRSAIEDYFKKIASVNEFPDYAGMLLFLRLEKDDVEEYCKTSDEYARVFRDSKLMRESFLVRRMTKDKSLAQGCMNALRQPENGGYSEKTAEKQTKKLIIVTDGVGKDAFK